MKDTIQHTPAPWIIEGRTIWNPGTKRAIYATAEKPINERDKIGQANAHLIAAAPELLEALQMLVEEEVYILNHTPHMRDFEGFNKARAAINKAKGE